MGKKVAKPTYGPATPGSIVPDPDDLIDRALTGGPQPDEFVFVHGIVARYTTGSWGQQYAVQPCLGCNATGRIDTDSWAVVPDIEGYPHGTCPVCLGTQWQPTLGTCKLALAHARMAVRRWDKEAAQYASEYAEMKMAAERGDEVHAIVVREEGVLKHYGTGDVPMLLHKLEGLGKRALRKSGLCEYDVGQIERFTDMLGRLRSHIKTVVQAGARAVVPAPPAPKHDPRKVCNGYEQKGGKRKRCHRPPQEWDEAGKGWCRRHAHKRGLHKQGEVA